MVTTDEGGVPRELHRGRRPVLMTGDSVVVRPTRTATWNLVRDGVSVASAYGVCRPDRHWFVSVDGWQEEDHEPLVNAMVADLPHDLYTRIDGADPRAVELWSRYGFEPHRREIEFLFSPDPARTGLGTATIPDGLALLPADGVDETTLRGLDDQLRNDVPGTQGWVNDPAEFHDFTFNERLFDPETYLVAIDDQRRRFAGLVRIWAVNNRSRVGMLGVARPYRRQGLARALLASALAPIHERGVLDVMAEVDATNAAGLAMIRGIEAVETGSSVVLKRRATPSDGGGG